MNSIHQMTFQDLKELVYAYVQRVPTSLSVRSTMRMVALSKSIPTGSKVLDVGCGDGCLGQLYPREAKLILDGIDLSPYELKIAEETGGYRKLLVADISRFTSQERYDVVVGNCSMEHVPDIHAALANIYQLLKPGGKLLLSVPAFGWARSLGAVAWLEARSQRLGMAAAGALDGFFQHHHLYGHETWRAVLLANGFEVTSTAGLGGKRVNQVFQRGLPIALFEFCFKTVFRRYPNIGRVRTVPCNETLNEIWSQPVAFDSPYRIEYVLEAIRPA